MKTLFILLFSTLYIASYGQSDWEVSVTNAGDIDGRVENFLQVVQANVYNPGAAVEVHYQLTITRSDVGLDISNNSFYQDYTFVAAPGDNPYSYSSITAQFDGVDITDYDFGSAPPGYEAYIQDERRFPPGEYSTCLSVYSVDTDMMMSMELASSCLNFEVSPRNAPVIQNPDDVPNGAWLGGGEDVFFQVGWYHAEVFGEEYTLEIKRFADYEAARIFDKGDHNTFDGMPLAIIPERGISELFYNVTDDNVAELGVGDFIAIRVTAGSEDNPQLNQYINQGRSNIVIAAYGTSPELSCYHPNFLSEVVWPLPGDTLPFRNIHYVTRFEPLCDNLREFESTFVTSDRSGEIRRTTVDNNWIAHGGPYNNLVHFADVNPAYDISWVLPDSSYAQHLPLIHSSENSSVYNPVVPNEDGYRLSANMIYTFDDLPTGTVQTQMQALTEFMGESYHVGMPTPQLISPAHDDVMSPGDITFNFNTGQQPEDVLPPFQIMKIQGSSNVTNPYLNVQEKLVLQVSADEEFTNSEILYDGLRTIQASSGHPDMTQDWETPTFSSLPGDVPIQQTTDRLYLEDLFMDQVYKSGDMTFNFETEDTVYWRVVWLQNPEAYNSSSPKDAGESISESDTYNISPVRRLIIREGGDDIADSTGGEDDSPVEENTPTTCSTSCSPTAPTESAASDVSTRTVIKVGYFAITDIEQSGDNNNSITGIGVVEVPFLNGVKIKVDLANVRITEAGKVLSGSIKAHEDSSPFDLSTINANVASSASAIPGVGTVNTWLQENVPEGRIVTSLVSGEPIGMPLGFDREINGHNLLIGITDMQFTPEGATVKVLYEHQFDKLGEDQYISLRGDICLKPSGFGAEVMLALNRDFAINDFDADTEGESDIDRIVFKGSNSSDLNTVRDEATHIAFHCACVKSMGIKMEATLNEDRFIKDYEGETVPTDSLAKMRFGILLRRDVACNVEDLPENIPADSIRANNFMVSLDMDDFQYKKFDGWAFRVDEAYVDLSDLENPAAITFPSDYDHSAVSAGGALLNTWTGFYLKELSVKAPKDLYDNNADRRFSAGLRNVIIDRTGFTLDAFVENVVSVETGSAGGWAFSLDEFRLRIVQSTFRSGSMNGEIGVPIMKPGDNLDYDAVLSYSPDQTNKKWGFFLNIEPEGELQLPPVLGTANINDNSYIAYTYGYVPPSVLPSGTPSEVRESKKIALKFAGNIDIDSEDDGFAGQVGSLASTIGFSGVTFALGYSDVRGFYEHDFAFASPQKMMGSSSGDEESVGVSGFPVTIKDWNLESDFGDGRCIGATLSITPQINFMGEGEGGLMASTEILIPCEYNTETKRFGLNSPSIGEVCFGISTSSEGGSEQNGITLEGCIEFYKNAPRCDIIASGVRGNLRVGTPVAEVVLNAEFGSNEDFRYFFVDGKATFQNGLPLGSLQLLGIGGGFYYNMSVNNPGESDQYNSGDMASMTAMHSADKIPDGNPADDEVVRGLSVASSGLNPCPQEGVTAFKLLLPIATAGDPSAFNMDVSTLIQVERGRGVTYFNVIGDGYVMSDISERATAPIKADIILEFSKPDPDTKKFHGGFDLYVDFEYPEVDLTIKGTSEQDALDGNRRSLFVGADFDFEKRGDEDATISFKMGSPQDPGGINIDLLGILQVEGKHYMQAGNNLDLGFMEKPALVARLLGEDNTSGEGGELSTATLSDTNLPNNIQVAEGQEVSGFNMGLSLEAEVDLDMFLIYAKLGFAVGFDLSVANLGAGSYCFQPDGTEINPVGADGWYTTGQIYAGLEGEVGLQIKLIRTRRFALFSLGAAVSLQGGFPKPTWAEGKAGVRYSVLGGLVSGQANLKVSAGTKCIPPRTDPFGFDIIDELKPEGGEVSPFYSAQASFVVPIGETLNIPVLDEDGNVLGIEYVKPIMSPSNPFEIMANGVSQSIMPVQWSDDMTICTVTPTDPLALADIKFKVNVQAMEWRDGGFRSAIINGEIWETSKETTFRTTDFPEVIDDNLIEYCMPVKGQQFHLQDDRKEAIHRVKFDRNLNSSYFYPKKDDINYKYIARYEPYNGDAHIDSDVIVRSSGTIDVVDEPTLDNKTIYNFSIIRKEVAFQESSSTTQSTSGLSGVLPELNTSILSENVNMRLIQTQNMDYFQSQYNGSLKLLSNAKALQPGQKRSDIETIILSYDFKTSEYNTLADKLASAESEYTTDFNSGDIPTQALEVYAEEHFDRVDIFGTSFSGNQPLLGLFPDSDNPTYRQLEKDNFYDYAATLITGYRRENTSTLPGIYTPDVKYQVDIRAGSAFIISDGAVVKRYFDLPTIMNISDFDMGFNGGGYGISNMQPTRLKTILSNNIYLPLSQNDVDYAWENYLSTLPLSSGSSDMPMTSLDSEEDSSVGSGISNITVDVSGFPNNNGISGIGSSSPFSPIGAFNSSVASGIGLGQVINIPGSDINIADQLKNSRYKVLIANYELGYKLRLDFDRFYNNIQTLSSLSMYYVHRTDASNVVRVDHHLYLAHLVDRFGPITNGGDFYTFKDNLYQKKYFSDFSLQRGIYGFSIDHLLFELDNIGSFKANDGKQFEFTY